MKPGETPSPGAPMEGARPIEAATPRKKSAHTDISEGNTTRSGAWPRTGRPISRWMNTMAHSVASIYRDFPFISVLPMCLVYVLYWMHITLDRYYSLHSAIYDLGLGMEGGWVFTNAGPWTSALSYVAAIGYTPTRFLFSPITLGASYPALLLFQAIALASGAVAVHAIARIRLGGHFAPLILATIYLTYPPLVGLNWFDFHWDMLFVPLFLFGYLLFVRRQFMFSAVLMLLGGMTTYPYLILAGLFGLLTVMEALWPRFTRKSSIDSAKLRYSIVILVVASSFFVYQTAYLSLFNVNAFLHLSAFTSAAHATSVATSSDLWNRTEVLLIFFGPLFFLPLFSPKWLIMSTPFILLVTLSGHSSYAFPTILQLQYGALAIPIVFAGGIEVLGLARGRGHEADRSEAGGHRSRIRFVSRLHWRLPVRLNRGRTLSCVAALFMVCLFLALIYQPYGPWNATGPDPFPFNETQPVNMTYFGELEHLINLVPRTEPNFLVQNDMPYALPRDLGYEQTPLVSSELQWVNVSVWDAQQNRFPLVLPIEGTVQAQVEYLLDNPQGYVFNAGVSANISMYAFVRATYESGYYGVLAQASGMMLLERNYRGTPVYYVPYQKYFPATSLWSWQNNGTSTSPIIERNNSSNGRVWWGPYVTLSPGTYHASMWLRTSDLSSNASIRVFVTADSGNIVLQSAVIRGSNFTLPDKWQPISLTFTLNNTYENMEFASFDATWPGSIAIKGIDLVQTAPAVNPLT